MKERVTEERVGFPEARGAFGGLGAPGAPRPGRVTEERIGFPEARGAFGGLGAPGAPKLQWFDIVGPLGYKVRVLSPDADAS
jgi:hypothetical protein